MITPRQLLIGKILGIGIVALDPRRRADRRGARDDAGHGRRPHQRRRRPATSPSAAVWFVLGYALYCSAYAAAGSLVSRVEDAQSVAFPIMLPLLFGYIVSFSAAGGASTLLWVLAFIPPTAVVAMPTLYAIGAAEPWMVARVDGAHRRRHRRRRHRGVEGLRAVGPPLRPQDVVEGRPARPVRDRRRPPAAAPSPPTDAGHAKPTWTSRRPRPSTSQASPGGRAAAGAAGSSSPSRSPSMSAQAAARTPMRLRRTTAVQCPNSDAQGVGPAGRGDEEAGPPFGQQRGEASPGSATRSASSTTQQGRAARRRTSSQRRRRAWRRRSGGQHGDGRGATTRTQPARDGRRATSPPIARAPWCARRAPGRRPARARRRGRSAPPASSVSKSMPTTSSSVPSADRRPAGRAARGDVRSASTPIGGGPPGPPANPSEQRRRDRPPGPRSRVAATTRRPGIGAGARRAGTPDDRALARVVEVAAPTAPDTPPARHAGTAPGPLGREDGRRCRRPAPRRRGGPGCRRRRGRAGRRARPAAPAARRWPRTTAGRPGRRRRPAGRRARRQPAQQARQALPLVWPHHAGAVVERRRASSRPVVAARVDRRRRGASPARRPRQAARSTDRSVVVVPDADGADDERGCRRPASSASGSRRCSPGSSTRPTAPAAARRRRRGCAGQRRQPRPVRRLRRRTARRRCGSSARARPARSSSAAVVVDDRRRVADDAQPRHRPSVAPGPSCGRPGTRRARPARAAASCVPAPGAGTRPGRRAPTTSRASATSCSAQRDAQVGVGPDVVADDPARAAASPARGGRRGCGRAGRCRRARRRSRAARRPASANSSTTTTSRGSGGRAGTARQSVRSTAPTDRSSRSRRRSSASRLTQRPLGESVVEVGDDADGVRQLGAGVERGAALVVDEHEADVVGAAASGERGDEGAQQLALARAGRAGDQRVRAVAGEVDLDDAVGGRAEDGDGRRVGTGRAPRRGDGDGVVDRSGAVAGVERAEPTRRRAAPRRRRRPRDR